MANEEFDGELISELGVKKYMKGRNDMQFSNINFFYREGGQGKDWEPCRMGCHGPTYRSLRRDAKWNQALDFMDKVDPSLSGIVDGLRQNTFHQFDMVTRGANRTAEGLHLNGSKKFGQVGSENLAVYNFATGMFEKLVSIELDVMDNPMMQALTFIVNEYISVLPEWMIEEALTQGALIFPEPISEETLQKAIKKGVITVVTSEEAKQAAAIVNDKAKRFVGKQIGKKLAAAIASAIAVAVTKKIMRDNAKNLYRVKRQLVNFRKMARSAGGNMGTALLVLLKTQGLLDQAAETSRELQRSSPVIWNFMRYKLNGADMVYFLVEGMIHEYVDRLSLLQRNPEAFMQAMKALIESKRTKEIFFPT